MVLKHFLAGLLSDTEYIINTVMLSAGKQTLQVRTKELTVSGWQMLYNVNTIKEVDEDCDEY